jgi:hypothetical protein
MFLWQVEFWLANNLLLKLQGSRAVYFIRHRKLKIELHEPVENENELRYSGRVGNFCSNTSSWLFVGKYFIHFDIRVKCQPLHIWANTIVIRNYNSLEHYILNLRDTSCHMYIFYRIFALFRQCDRHEIAEILLNMALNTTNQSNRYRLHTCR